MYEARGLTIRSTCLQRPGHMIKKKYGQYIDRHEVVVRFNVAVRFELLF